MSSASQGVVSSGLLLMVQKSRLSPVDVVEDIPVFIGVL